MTLYCHLQAPRHSAEGGLEVGDAYEQHEKQDATSEHQ